MCTVLRSKWNHQEFLCLVFQISVHNLKSFERYLCAVCRVSGTPVEVIGIDLTTTTAKPMRPATLNAQVAAALYLRCLASPNEAAQKKAKAMFRTAMSSLQRDTVTHIRDVAWEVKETESEGCLPRIPQDEISIDPNEEATKPESPTTELTKLYEEPRHTGLRRGTKRSLLAGSGKFSGELTQQRWGPHLYLGPRSWVLHAQADPAQDLKACRKKRFETNLTCCFQETKFFFGEYHSRIDSATSGATAANMLGQMSFGATL